MRAAKERAIAHAALNTALTMDVTQHQGRKTRNELLQKALEFTKPRKWWRFW